MSEKNSAGRRATIVPGMFQNVRLEPREQGQPAGGRSEEQQGSAGQGLAGHCKDFFLQATGSHGSVLREEGTTSLSFS